MQEIKIFLKRCIKLQFNTNLKMQNIIYINNMFQINTTIEMQIRKITNQILYELSQLWQTSDKNFPAHSFKDYHQDFHNITIENVVVIDL